MSRGLPPEGPVRDIITELAKVWPDATKGVLGSHRIYRQRDETPAHKFESVIKPLPGPRLLQLVARDGFDDGLAAFLLDCIDEANLPGLASKKLRVFAAEFPESWPFECVVIVPPKIAERFDNESARLKRITYWVVPAFAYEFRNGENKDGFWYQLYRKDGWNVTVVRWHRSRKSKPDWD